MERAVAIKKLGKILGKQLGYRVDHKAPDQDDRDEAKAKLPDARARRDALEKQMQARRKALLDADEQYRQIGDAYKQARKECEELMGITGHYRFTVGVSAGPFFIVKAQGDSWEQVIAKLTEKKVAAG